MLVGECARHIIRSAIRVLHERSHHAIGLRKSRHWLIGHVGLIDRHAHCVSKPRQVAELADINVAGVVVVVVHEAIELIHCKRQRRETGSGGQRR